MEPTGATILAQAPFGMLAFWLHTVFAEGQQSNLRTSPVAQGFPGRWDCEVPDACG